MNQGIYVPHLRDEVIIPTLKEIGLYSESAVNLLLGTAAQESHMGYYLKQLGKGPALSIYQIEPATHADMWVWLMTRKEKLAIEVLLYSGLYVEHLFTGCFGDYKKYAKDLEPALLYNLRYATAMARVFYFRFPQPLPEADDWKGHAAYWKKYYNTHLGRGTEDEFLANVKRFGLMK